MATADVATSPRGEMVEAALVDAVATITVRGDLDDAVILDAARAIADSVSRAPDRGSPRALAAIARDTESWEYAT